MKNILLILLMVFAFTVKGQLQSKDMEENLNALIQNLQSNPENPLLIDQNILNSIAQLIPDAQQKDVFQGYAKILNSDADLSYRQVYWDLRNVFNQNASLMQDSKLAQLNFQLTSIMEDSHFLMDKLKDQPLDKQLGIFITDPSVMQGLQALTGSSEDAAAINSMTKAVAELIRESRINKDNMEKVKKDYKAISEISYKILYNEKDPNTKLGLIDAYLGYWPFHMLTPMYRYDFNNGAQLRVENGILKYVNSSKRISKDLAIVDQRNNGDYRGSGRVASNTTPRYNSPVVLVSPDEKVFFISIVKDKALSNIGCTTCLGDKSFSALLDANTGQIIQDKIAGWNYLPWGYHYNATFDKKNDLSFYQYSIAPVGYGIWKYFCSTTERKVGRNGGVFMSGIDKEKKFQLPGENPAFKKLNPLEFIGKDPINFFTLNEKENIVTGIFWDIAGEHSSSLLQIAQGELFNKDGMVNELTGMVTNSLGDIYFSGANGGIGKINSVNNEPMTPGFPEKIRATLAKRVVQPYDFISSRKYAAEQGSLTYNANAQSFEINSPPPILPSLTLTPDEKTLIYIVKDSLYLMNTNNLADIKRFGLSFQPYASFYTKENSSYVLNLMALDDLMYPIIKKYSISRLIEIDTRRKITNSISPSFAKSNSSTNANSTISVADELKKLKELMDQGILTKEEFEQEKKKLLGQSSQNNTVSSLSKSSPNNPSNTPIANKSNGNDRISFNINGKTYCGVRSMIPGVTLTGRYEYQHNSPYNKGKGEPIVFLGENFEGQFQYHDPKFYDVEWWLECGPDGNPSKEIGSEFTRYILVLKFKEDDHYDRMILDVHPDKIVILGERVKQR